MKTVKIILILVAIVVGLYFAIKWYLNKDIPRASGGTVPTDADKNCASGGASGKVIVGSCTRPMVFPIPPGVKEKCFTSEQLGLNEGDSVYTIVTDLNGFGTKWYFNYQSGDRFCYTNKKL